MSTERIMICPAPVLAAALSLTPALEGLYGHGCVRPAPPDGCRQSLKRPDQTRRLLRCLAIGLGTQIVLFIGRLAE